MTEQELRGALAVGRTPVLIFCEKQYEGICRMLKIKDEHTVFLDYDDTADDAASEGAFRVTIRYADFACMVQAVEQFTGKPLEALELNPRCEALFACDKPQWEQVRRDVYSGSIPMLTGYEACSIGSIYWNGLYQRQIRPDSSNEELTAWLKKLAEEQE